VCPEAFIFSQIRLSALLIWLPGSNLPKSLQQRQRLSLLTFFLGAFFSDPLYVPELSFALKVRAFFLIFLRPIFSTDVKAEKKLAFSEYIQDLGPESEFSYLQGEEIFEFGQVPYAID
jgi:hypothetical protein